MYTFGFITMTGCRFAKSFFLFQLHFFTAKREFTKQIFATFFSDCVVGNGRHCCSRGVFTLYRPYCSLVDRSSPSIAATFVDKDVKVPRSLVTTTIVKRLEGSSFPRFSLTPIVAWRYSFPLVTALWSRQEFFFCCFPTSTLRLGSFSSFFPRYRYYWDFYFWTKILACPCLHC